MYDVSMCVVYVTLSQDAVHGAFVQGFVECNGVVYYMYCTMLCLCTFVVDYVGSWLLLVIVVVFSWRCFDTCAKLLLSVIYGVSQWIPIWLYFYARYMTYGVHGLGI